VQTDLAKKEKEKESYLCAALMAHVERLSSLLEPAWPNAGRVHEEMYNMVDTLVIHTVDQKCFSTFA
jgi:hypothetical protein